MDVAFIDHYDSFSFNVIAWLTGKNDLHNVKTIAYDDPAAIRGLLEQPVPIVLSPGPKSPKQAASSIKLCQRLIGVVPVLGICLGHQILGASLGASIIRSKHPFHGSKRNIYLNANFARRFNLPDTYTAATYNSLIIAENSLPPEVTIAAKNEFLEVEAIFYEGGKFPALGLQHHPESFLSEGHDGILELWRDWVSTFYTQRKLRSPLKNSKANSEKLSHVNAFPN